MASELSVALSLARHTSIGWTGRTWNPTKGCSLVSPGCANCYAMIQAWRFAGPGLPYEGLVRKRARLGPVWTGALALAGDAKFYEPLHWAAPSLVFVNSMSDVFHEALTDAQILEVFAVMAACPQHVFQVLTKRARRMPGFFARVSADRVAARAKELLLARTAGSMSKRAWLSHCDRLASKAWNVWPLPNVWLGVSVESQEYADERLPLLMETPSVLRWASFEPLLGRVDARRWLGASVDCVPGARDGRRGLGWGVFGGESCDTIKKARYFDPDWGEDLLQQGRAADVPMFCKQLGTVWSVANGLGAGKADAPARWPASLRVQQMPLGLVAPAAPARVHLPLAPSAAQELTS